MERYFSTKKRSLGDGGSNNDNSKKQRNEDSSSTTSDSSSDKVSAMSETPSDDVSVNSEVTSGLVDAVASIAVTGGSSNSNSIMVDGVMPLTDAGWVEALKPEFSKPYFVKLASFLRSEHAQKKTIFPPRDLVFNAFNSCPLSNVKVVILGQDPYHGPKQAHGLSFSVLPGIPQPPSLRNMITEAVKCCGIRATKSGCLKAWCGQGVFLLNTVLTVEKSKAFSHQKKGWEQFTDSVIKVLNKSERPIIFLLWGKPSQLKGSSIDQTKHKVIMSSHPSPLGATKTSQPFTGSKCFLKANEMLKELGHKPIDWNL